MDAQAVRRWAVATHASALIGFVVPLGNVLAPLVIWSSLRHEDPFLDAQGREVLNFQLSMLLYTVIGGILLLLFLGLLIVLSVAFLEIVFVTLASFAASRGVTYHYPATIRFLGVSPVETMA